MGSPENISKLIVQKALSLGYENCGIIGIDEVGDYADKLRERLEKTPEDKARMSHFYKFANLKEQYPFARSIVVCVGRYGKYRVPERLKGIIGKYYLFDGRKNEDSAEHQSSLQLEAYMQSLGLKTETERSFGITALRWAAYKAGLGLIRRNNFFYTDSGSWVYLEAWLTDRDMSLKQNVSLTPCPSGCDLCVSACPTKSLSEAYTMSRLSCISCLTTWTGDDLLNDPHSREIGNWIYGCDVCQDVCPFNVKKWDSEGEFPGLRELAEAISPEQILDMDSEFLENVIQPKFWYISKDRLGKWKINAQNSLRNSSGRLM